MLRAAVVALCTGSALASQMKYELFPYDSVAEADAVHVVGNARFTVLTDSLIRMEYSNGAHFEDRPTLAVVNRKTAVPKHSVAQIGQGIVITTERVNLTYIPGSAGFDTANQLTVVAVGDSTFKTWNHGETSFTDDMNLRGTYRTLDGKGVVPVDCKNSKLLHCEWGLMSRNGWALIDDTGVPVMDDDDWWTDESGKMLNNSNDEDIYLLAHSHRYMDALKDYTSIGGHIPIFPRSNHGAWFTRWLYYTSNDVVHVINEYQNNGMPLDIMVLDMNWHKKNDWSGYSWDKHLFPYPKDFTDFVHRHGLKLAANLHDATGVGSWEDKYPEMCEKLGLDPSKPPGPKGIPFTLTNKSYVNALEDIVLKTIEDDGMDFWWIDWQQGENAAGTGQDGARMKMNPTIWTDKMRCTDSIRRCAQGGDCTNKRGVVHARWGGLGNHRYQHGFSGDVAGLQWDNLAFQSYFSATASNVGWGWWSHDIEGPGTDNEMYVRWLQLGCVSGIMRSHDRGMSAGGCQKYPDNNDCPHVRPYNTPLLFRDIHREALVMRVAMIPYLYTQTKAGYDVGLGLTRPMYYYWPEEDMAYPASFTDNLGKESTTRQYMFGDSILASPVTVASNCDSSIGTLDSPCGVTSQDLWVPPGAWVEMHSGVVYTGPATIQKTYSLYEIPMYAKAGAIIPTIPVRTGDTIGLASRQYTELEFSVYPGANSGSYDVYEDDGETYDYLKGLSSTISAHYTRSGELLAFNINTTGSFPGQPTERRYTIKLVNSGPANSVTVMVGGGQTVLPYSRWGGAGTWSYHGGQMALVVELDAVAVADAVQVKIVSHDVPGLTGLRGVVSRSVLAKRTLDETRETPGHAQPDAGGSPLSVLAELGQALSYLAGGDVSIFSATVASAPEFLRNATSELTALAKDKGMSREGYALDLITNAGK